MRPLIALRSHSDPGTDDLMWPVATDELLIRLEPGEVIRWQGPATVGEARRPHRDNADPHRAWLLRHADVVITDRRVTYRGHDIERCTCQWGASLAHLDQARSAMTPATLFGQVRFQWPFAIVLAHQAEPALWAVTCQCTTADEHAFLTLGVADEAVAANVAVGLVTDVARFRLAARARTLKRAEIRPLNAQRERPAPKFAKEGSSRVWELPGAMVIGAKADIRPRPDPLYQAAMEAIEQFEAGGDVALIDKAMSLATEAGKDPSASAFDENHYLNFIAGALMLRYERYGDLGDLSRCIDTQRVTAERAADEAPGLLADATGNLGMALIERYEHGLDEQDLTDGIAALEQAVAAADRASSEYPGHLDTLGVALKARFPSTMNLEDLDRAIISHENALAHWAPDSPDAPPAMVNLANALTFRYDAAGDLSDLSRAVSVGQEAVRLVGRRSPARAVALLSLALSAGKLHGATGEPGHSRTAVDAWREGCREARAAQPGVALRAASSWATAMIDSGDWATALEACEVGLSTLDRLYQGQSAREHMDIRLGEAGGLACVEGYALAKLGRLRDAAVALERGRAAYLHESDEQFRAPPSFADVAAAAAGTCLAYLTVTEAGGFALLANGQAGDGDPRLSVIWLDDLTTSAVMRLGEDFRLRFLPAFLDGDDHQYRATLDSVTSRLWDLAIGPVLASRPGGQLTLIPSGYLDLLPLHAAWTQPPGEGSRRYAIDEALITYAPSARILRAVRSRPPGPATGILAVYDPTLPNSLREVHDAYKWFDRGTISRTDRMTCQSLRDRLPAYSVLHFSCHGFADLLAPLDSGVSAARDQPLTLRDVIGTPLRARLCVLSACESAIAGGFAPDQALSLPAGFLLAGADGVVGTLWEVRDLAARRLVSAFFELWQGRGIQPAEALRQAQARIRAPDGRLDANWAAFMYVGT